MSDNDYTRVDPVEEQDSPSEELELWLREYYNEYLNDALGG